MIKAVALYSGGLDSILAIKIIEEQGIDVYPVSFYHPFFGKIDKRNFKDLKREPEIIDISEEFFKILKSPKYGYGKNLNPCMDCRILYFKKAKEYMEKIKAKFLISGEIVGQRPFSQRREAISTIEREANVIGIVVRPLTQKNLPPSIPEKEGLVDRQRLLGISGRNRQHQLKLAKKYSLSFIPTPAGGCLLTVADFVKRTKELLKRDMLSKENVEILKYGRFFVLGEKSILIIGRNKNENERLKNLYSDKNEHTFIETLSPPGPSAIIIGEKLIEDAISIIKKYIKYKEKPEFLIK